MPRDPHPPEPPGEDPLDLPEVVGWLVAACTWLRRLALSLGGPTRRARLPARPCRV